ncbi:Spo0B domain-containing protein [Virgibacillus sp. 179-BFC.A HS]|uniref:Spo0B domain-containing protein n=1 Tax=Tigheibacillus jepli TaxID=3035914 RepID=A0ABU5CIV4_9BACI|nr:Spo0B domain-containing protein [Virgibacillus sp. 179-BFC.A HS]MDY0405458.1 Spo0B domain-containing protein [Virgibacillus sp. 179-BFC.A HS]
METSEVLRLLQHNRHDLMNQIQLLKGYASMGKMEKVQEKLESMIQSADQERKLMNLHADEFSLWLIQFNRRYANLRLVYEVHITDANLSKMDAKMYRCAASIFSAIQSAADANELYHGKLEIHNKDESGVILHILLDGVGLNQSTLGKIVEEGHIRVNLISDSRTEIEVHIADNQ